MSEQMVVKVIEDWGDDIVGVKAGEIYPFISQQLIGKEKMFIIHWRGDRLRVLGAWQLRMAADAPGLF